MIQNGNRAVYNIIYQVLYYGIHIWLRNNHGGFELVNYNLVDTNERQLLCMSVPKIPEKLQAWVLEFLGRIPTYPICECHMSNILMERNEWEPIRKSSAKVKKSSISNFLLLVLLLLCTIESTGCPIWVSITHFFFSSLGINTPFNYLL